MTTKEKLQFLEIRMKHFGFNENVKIEKSDPRMGKKFVLLEVSPEGRTKNLSSFMTLEGLEGYIDGVIDSKKYIS